MNDRFEAAFRRQACRPECTHRPGISRLKPTLGPGCLDDSMFLGGNYQTYGNA